MRKVLLVGLIFGLVLAFATFAMAKSNPQFPCPCVPTNLYAYITGGGDDAAPADIAPSAEVCFEWSWGCGANVVKYAIEVEMLVGGTDWNDSAADIRKVTFCTADRTDYLLPTVPSLCVPIEAFVYWDGASYVPFSGDARFRVKGLGSGNVKTKAGFSQNNCFSAWYEFEIGGVAPDGAP